MATIKCKMCGSDNIQIDAGKTYGTCEMCDSVMTLPKVSGEQLENAPDADTQALYENEARKK